MSEPTKTQDQQQRDADEKARKREEHKRKILDDAVADTFPASDPVSVEHPADDEPDRGDKR